MNLFRGVDYEAEHGKDWGKIKSREDFQELVEDYFKSPIGKEAFAPADGKMYPRAPLYWGDLISQYAINYDLEAPEDVNNMYQDMFG